MMFLGVIWPLISTTFAECLLCTVHSQVLTSRCTDSHRMQRASRPSGPWTAGRHRTRSASPAGRHPAPRWEALGLGRGHSPSLAASISHLHFAGEETEAQRVRWCAQGHSFQKPSRPCAARGREHAQCAPSLPWGGPSRSHTSPGPRSKRPGLAAGGERAGRQERCVRAVASAHSI